MQNKVLKFEKELANCSNSELVDRFNQEVGLHSWVSSRGAFLLALCNAFESRNLDCSAIKKDNSISLKRKVKLDGSILVLCS